MAVTQSQSLSVGIVGIPNAGKSTLFNSLTKCVVPAENFPFCTIDKNIGIVKIPDTRLDQLSGFFKAEKVVPSAIKFVDIAGLVKGASKGEGLGNQFLAHIREVDVIMYVLRAFSGEKIVHVYDKVDPLNDLKIVESELIIKDIETVEKRIGEVKKTIKSGADEKTAKHIALLERLLNHLGEGKCAIDLKVDEDEAELIRDLWLLTNKKRMYILNVKEGLDEPQLEDWKKSIVDYVGGDADFILCVDVKMIGDMSEMDEESKKEYLEMLGGSPVLIEDIIKTAYKRLGLLTFYTGSSQECNAWTIKAGATVQEASGVIHTDLAKNFITADVVNVEDLVTSGGWANAKEKGMIRNHGKEYLVQDGDYIIVYLTKGKN